MPLCIDDVIEAEEKAKSVGKKAALGAVGVAAAGAIINNITNDDF